MPSKGRKLELQTLNSLHGAADDARLQRQRWLRAIALLVGQDSDPLAKFLDPGMSTRGSISSEERASQFGVRLEDAPVAEGEFAGRQVPTTLLLMWAELNGRAKDGLELEGIFRLSADATEVSDIKKRLHDARSAEVAKAACHAASGYCLAALIKKYLRDLPDDLWGPVRPALDAAVADVMAGKGPGEPAKLLARLPPRSAALFGWCCDVCAVVIGREGDNCMNPTAVATVMAPGLVRAPEFAQDPMALLDYSNAAVEWLEFVLRNPPASTEAAAAAVAAVSVGGGEGGEGGGAPALEKRASVVRRAAPQENVHMRRVSQLASVAGRAR